MFDIGIDRAPCIFLRREVPVREGTCPRLSALEVHFLNINLEQ